MIAADFLSRADGAAPTRRAAHAQQRRAPAHAGTARKSHRKPRSRSSPVRTGSSSPDGRARSPSASPPARGSITARPSCAPPAHWPPPAHWATAIDACPNVQLATMASLDDRHHLLTQRAGLSGSSAYFSLKPPSVPVRLVSTRAQALAAPAPFAPYAPAAPPRSRALYHAPGDYTVPNAYTRASCSAACTHRRAGRRVVRRLLADLVSALPLVSHVDQESRHKPSASSNSCCNGTRPDKTSVPPVSSRRPTLRGPMGESEKTCQVNSVPPSASSPGDYHSVAVQALSRKKSTDEDDAYNNFDESQNDGWVGGVRALRDSHVRLVLRQLRHIERLNRALDRAPRAPCPPPPAPAPPAPRYNTKTNARPAL